MVANNTDENDATNRVQMNGLNRRNVLQTVGAATVAGAGLTAVTGTASAHEVHDHVFCGCTQVCACGKGTVEIIVAFETENGFRCETEFLHKGKDEFSECFEAEDGGKVVALKPHNGDTICNPNEQCAHLREGTPALPGCVFKCDKEGKSPKHGRRCGDVFLRDCGP